MSAKGKDSFVVVLDESDLKTPGRGYTREPGVIADIRALRAAPQTEFWRRAQITDYQAEGCPHLESLVYWLRRFHMEARQEEAWRIADILTTRVAKTVRRRMAAWRLISVDQREEIEDSVLVSLYEEWFSHEPGHEFWEVRFAVCLERTISDALDKHSRDTRRIVTLRGYEDDENDATDRLAEFPDHRAKDPAMIALINSALDYVGEPERTAFFLYYHEGWSEEEIAKRFGKTSRTVRNYLMRARDRLQTWRGAEGQ